MSNFQMDFKQLPVLFDYTQFVGVAEYGLSRWLAKPLGFTAHSGSNPDPGVYLLSVIKTLLYFSYNSIPAMMFPGSQMNKINMIIGVISVRNTCQIDTDKCCCAEDR